MMVMCDASGITGHDRRTPELSNAALHMTQDTNNIEKFKVKLTLASPSGMKKNMFSLFKDSPSASNSLP